MSSYLSLSIELPLLVFLIPFIFLLLMQQRKQNAKAKRLPPGPRRLPLIGNLHHLYDDLPHRVLQHLSSQYGPLMFLQLGSRSTLVVTFYHAWISWINKFSGLEQRVDKCFKNLDNFYNKVIEEHLDPQRPNPENEDVIDVLLRVQKDPSQSIVLTDEQIKGVITDMFIAGTDTTSAVLVWTMTELIRNPKVVELALANLLYCFDWELPDGVKRDDLDMKEAAGLTVQKKVPLCLAARPALLIS
ncbi:hypothetical protein M0R45_023984 [Rubus argutus]|uniref:Uncharacterized protein n=1 Tax=Rubus argutus TaxID=59490 RepID=A0AAW1WSY9_RUBAR